MPTLKSLYQRVTGDQVTHQRTIAALLARQSAARRRLAKLYVQGASDRQAGERTHRSYGAARSVFRLTMFAIFKAANGKERYWKTGRRAPKREAAKRAYDEAAARTRENAADLKNYQEANHQRQALYTRNPVLDKLTQ